MNELGSTLTHIDRMNAAYSAAQKRGYRHPMLAAVKELRVLLLEIEARAARKWSHAASNHLPTQRDQAANCLLLSIAQHEEKYLDELP